MTITCFIIDDEPHAVEALSLLIRRTPGLELSGSATDPLQALAVLNAAPLPMLLFLDVDMPELNGLELAGLIRGRCTIIFTTAYREYATEAFELQAADYLLKPFRYERFLQSILKAGKEIVARNNAGEQSYLTLFVKTGVQGKFVSVHPDEILYVSGAMNYIEIHLKDRIVMAYLTLSELLEQLPAGGFSRIHKSHFVNRQAIVSLETGQVHLLNDITLPIGRSYRAAFQEQMRPLLVLSKREQST
jgi:two-component system LytT family response regulator